MFGDEFYAANATFADSLEHLADSDCLFGASSRQAPPGWRRDEGDGWVSVQPDGPRLPVQGWKVHVSAVPDEADEVIGVVWDYCVRQAVAFKFLRSSAIMAIRNGKQAARGSSGKLITIYPADDSQLAAALNDLPAALGERPGPYILSDLRWLQGPLYLRYGGFLRVQCLDDEDEWVPALLDQDGTAVPDLRNPTFHVPSWAPVPAVVAVQLAARDAEEPDEFRYEIKEALHFSNAGGIYQAIAPASGRAVVVREARPHAGLDGAGQDAVARLRRERDILRRLDGLDSAPELIDYFCAWEHHFLVEEYIEGDTLHHAVGTRYPYVYPTPSAETVTAYLAWALATIDAIDAALAAVHSRDVVFADLNTRNIMLRPDGSVVLVDFEQSFTLDEDFTPTIGTPGFTAAWARNGLSVDDFGMTCVVLSMFMPMTPVLGLHPAKAVELVSAATELFALPDDLVMRMTNGLRAPEDRRTSTGSAAGGPRPRATAGPATVAEFHADRPDWAGILRGMALAIGHSATADRADRAFPGDPAQFIDGAMNIAHGAAGVLYALWAVGATDMPGYDRCLTWLTAALRRTGSERPGYYTGLHGVAFVLDRLGRREEALHALDRVRRTDVRPRTVGFFNGLSGTGWVELYFARRLNDPVLWQAALASGRQLGAVLDSGDDAGIVAPKRAGLLRGWSGPAMFFLALYEATGDETQLRRARQALDRDLARCERSPGGLEVRDGPRWLTYLNNGSSGIGIAARQYLTHHADEAVMSVPKDISVPLTADYVMVPGFLNGRAGLVTALAVLAGDEDSGRHAITAQLRRFGWHAVTYQDGIAFPGDGLARLSMDLGTGTAGVLLAAHTALSSTAAALPLLGVAPVALP
jgi:hypothetical protein